MNTLEMRRAQLRELWLSILVLGSIWGFAEVVLGGAMGAAGLPFRSALLTGLGIGLMAIALALFMKPAALPAIAIVAILCKQLVVPILHVSLSCKANSCLAVLLHGAVLAGSSALVGRRLQRGVPARAATGAATGLLSAAAFYWVGLRVAPCPYLVSFSRVGGLQAFLRAEGLPWAVFSAVFFPTGYWLGEQLRAKVPAWEAKRPALYYVTKRVIVLGCWIASAWAIAAGL